MSEEAVSMLKKQISSKNTLPLYVFHGPESYLKEHYTSLLIKTLVPEGLEAFNLDKFEGKGLDIDALRDVCESIPVMNEKRVVIVSDFNLYKDAADGKLLKLISDLPETVCLVFLFDIIEHKPDARSKIAAAVKKHGLIVEFELQKQDQLISWVKRHFGSVDKQISASECEFFVFQCGGLMQNLKTEIQKVSAYSKHTTISREDISAVVIPVLEARVFDMTNAIVAGERKKAVNSYNDIVSIDEETSTGILAMITKQIWYIYLARLVIEGKKNTSTLMEICQFRSDYQARKYMESANKRKLGWIHHALECCYQTDKTLKSNGSDRDRSLELLLANLFV